MKISVSNNLLGQIHKQGSDGGVLELAFTRGLQVPIGNLQVFYELVVKNSHQLDKAVNSKELSPPNYFTAFYDHVYSEGFHICRICVNTTEHCVGTHFFLTQCSVSGWLEICHTVKIYAMDIYKCCTSDFDLFFRGCLD